MKVGDGGDYLVRPYNRLQLRSRALVGMRWLNYVDSLFESQSDKRSCWSMTSLAVPRD